MQFVEKDIENIYIEAFHTNIKYSSNLLILKKQISMTNLKNSNFLFKRRYLSMAGEQAPSNLFPFLTGKYLIPNQILKTDLYLPFL